MQAIVQSEHFRVDVAESRTTAIHYRATAPRTSAKGGAARGAGPGAGATDGAAGVVSGGGDALLVLAHGAGAPQTHPWMVRMARALAWRGLDVVTFNFLYAEAKRRVPDRTPVLEATWRSVVRALPARTDLGGKRLFIGGKSMGGRMATHVAATGGPEGIEGLQGVVLFGYPLHPPGRPDKRRVSHLERVEAPMLFVQGSRDPFGGPDELAPFVASAGRAVGGASPRTRVLAIEGGDHSLAPLKKSGLNLEEVVARVADEVMRFTA